MGKTIIFCEGITDLFFIGHCLKSFYGLTFDYTYKGNGKNPKEYNVGDNCIIIEIGGCNKLNNEVYIDRLKDNSSEEGKNLVIFDADFSPNSDGKKSGTGNNGFQNARQKLIDFKKNKDVEFDFYLWHDNENDGEIEDLLEELIPLEKSNLLECIKNSSDCLNKLHNIPEKRKPNNKSILNHYIYLLDQDQHHYCNPDAWNLSVEQCERLKKFHDFLKNYF